MKREHYRPFNPEQAKAGAPYGNINDEIEVAIDFWGDEYATGRIMRPLMRRWMAENFVYTDHHLVMLPIATCQCKPVFVGDALYDENGDKFQADMNCLNVIPRCTWEPARTRVEVNMDCDELDAEYRSRGLYGVANAAIQRAVEDGDVVPMETVKEIAQFVQGQVEGFLPGRMTSNLVWRNVTAEFFTKE